MSGDAHHDRHVARWRTIDPLVAPPPPLELAEGDRGLDLVAGGGTGRGRIRLQTVTDGDEAALWGALRTHRLHVELAGDGVTEAFAALLGEFDRHVEAVATPDDPEEAAVVVLPSRDVALAAPLLRYAFSPTTVIAVRTLTTGQPVAAGEGPTVGGPLVAGGSLRPADPGDAERLSEMAVELHAFDAQFGAVSRRAAGPRLLADAMADHLDRNPGWTWVATVDGEATGFVQVQPPDDAAWISPVVARQPAAYLAQLYVVPGRRHSGIGTALAARGRVLAEQAGCAVMLLHHVLPNPLSTPFWARQGCRPLWTIWQRRPAIRG